MRLLQLVNCGQLSEVCVAAAAPPPPPPRSAAGAGAARDGAQGEQKTNRQASDGASSRAGGKRVAASGSGRGLVLSGCTSLSPDARARLAAAVLG
jgi:hypothetical protein